MKYLILICIAILFPCFFGNTAGAFYYDNLFENEVSFSPFGDEYPSSNSPFGQGISPLGWGSSDGQDGFDKEGGEEDDGSHVDSPRDDLPLPGIPSLYIILLIFLYLLYIKAKDTQIKTNKIK